MPGVGEMELKITANVNDAISGITKVNTGLTKTAVETDKTTKSLFQLKEQLNQLKGGEGVFTETSLSKIKAYNAQIQQTEVEIKKLESAGVSGSNAIVKSFGDLYGAVRKLAYILPGVGIGAIFGLALNPLFDLISGLDLFNSKITTAESNLQNMNDVVADANKKAGEETTELKILYQTATNVNLSMQDRLNAVKALQREFPDYFKNIKAENILNGDSKKAYDDLTISIIANARAKAAKDKIDELEARRLDAEFIKEKIRNAQANESNRVVNTNGNVVVGPTRVVSANTPAGLAAVNVQKEIIKARADAALALKDIDIQSLQDQEDFLIKFAGGTDKLAKVIEDGIKPEKIKKGQKTIADILAELQRQIDFINNDPLIIQTDKAKKEIDLINAAIKELIGLKKLTFNNPVILSLVAKINDLELGQFIEKLKSDLRKERLQITVDEIPILQTLPEKRGEISKGFFDNQDVGTNVFPTDDQTQKANGNFDKYSTGFLHLIDLQKTLAQEGIKFSKFDTFQQLQKQQNEYLKSVQALQKNLDQIFTQIQSKILESLGDSIGKALTGKGTIGDIFGSIFQIIGAGLKQLGDSLIVYGVGIKALKLAITNPLAAIAAGLALEIAGSALQSSIPKFAGGVTNFQGGFATVGERGPETVYLPRGTDVISNYKQPTGSIGGGMNMAINVDGEFILTGANLIASLNRQTARNSRNG